MGVRINKALAQAGLGSRRKVETWIAAGRIQVNGKPAVLGQQIEPGDSVTFDDDVVTLEDAAERQVIVYNKPVGELCTREDPEGRPTVFERLPPLASGRWISVGRLDANTGGLLLFTTDGALAQRLMHPSSEVEREYAVRVLGKVTDEALVKLTTGVELDDGMARFLRVVPGGGEGANRWYTVVLAEGRQREVRRLWEALGYRVSRLLRVRFGNVSLPREMRPGEILELREEQIGSLEKTIRRSGAKTGRPRRRRRPGGPRGPGGNDRTE